MTPYIFLSISIFCKKKYWRRLISNDIPSLINLISSESSKKIYYFELNYQSGPNIRLSILSKKASAKEDSFKIDSFFKNLFISRNCTQRNQQISESLIFLPFPQNTVHYGIFQPQIYSSENQHFIKICTKLSQIITNALRSESVLSNVVIINLAIYLHVVVNTALIRNGWSHNQCVGFYRQFNVPASLSDESVTNKLYKETLIDIIHLSEDLFADQWIYDWRQICECEARRNISNRDAINLVDLIDTQLGITPSMKKIIFPIIISAFTYIR